MPLHDMILSILFLIFKEIAFVLKPKDTIKPITKAHL